MSELVAEELLNACENLVPTVRGRSGVIRLKDNCTLEQCKVHEVSYFSQQSMLYGYSDHNPVTFQLGMGIIVIVIILIVSVVIVIVIVIDIFITLSLSCSHPCSNHIALAFVIVPSCQHCSAHSTTHQRCPLSLQPCSLINPSEFV